MGGHRDDRYVLEAIVGRHPSRGLVTVELRHLQVHQHRVGHRSRRAQPGQRRRPRIRDLDRDAGPLEDLPGDPRGRSVEHTSELQSLLRISYAVFCLKTNNIAQTLTFTTLPTESTQTPLTTH